MKIDGTKWLKEAAYSFSKLSSFSKCPRKFFYRYILGRRETTTYQIYGRAVHFGQEQDNLAKVEGRVMPVQAVLDAAVEGLRAECAKEDVKMAVDPFVAEHRRQLEIYEDLPNGRQSVYPVKGSIEAPFKIELAVSSGYEGAEMVPCVIDGFTDVVSMDPRTEQKEVIDYKTGSKPVTQYDADNNLQFQLYAMGAEAGAARTISFVKGGKQKPTARTTKPSEATPQRQAKLLQWIADAVHAIRRCAKSGDYPKCDPGCYWCGSNACDFYALCYGCSREELGKVIEVKAVQPPGTVPMPWWRKRKA